MNVLVASSAVPAQLSSRTVVLDGPRRLPLGRLRSGGTIAGGRGVPPLRHYDSYAIVYIVAGEGSYLDERGTRAAIGPGDLILVVPQLGHSYGPGSGGVWDEIYLVFDGPVFDLWVTEGLLDIERPVRRLEPLELWLPRLESFLERQVAGDQTMELCRFLSLLAEIVREESGPAEDWLARARSILERDLRARLLVEDVAAELAMPSETFRKRFRAAVGVPPARYRRRRRIDAACELLRYPRLTNREMADALGFADEFHFSRRFRQELGVSPREFRARLSLGPQEPEDPTHGASA